MFFVYNTYGDKMARNLEKFQLVERSISKKYRHELWNPFIEAVKHYSLLKENDIIGIELLGDSRTALLVKLFQQLSRISDMPFVLEVADKSGRDLAHELNIPTVDRISSEAVSVGTVCYTDVIKGVLGSMLFEGEIKTTLPIENGVINPLYCVKSESVNAWVRYNDLDFDTDQGNDEIDKILQTLKKDNPNVEHSIFKSLHAVCLDTMVGYSKDGVNHSFLEKY